MKEREKSPKYRDYWYATGLKPLYTDVKCYADLTLKSQNPKNLKKKLSELKPVNGLPAPSLVHMTLPLTPGNEQHCPMIFVVHVPWRGMAIMVKWKDCLHLAWKM